MVMSSQTKDLICAMLTIPVAEKIMQSSKNEKDFGKEYFAIVQAYFNMRQEFEGVYDKR